MTIEEKTRSSDQPHVLAGQVLAFFTQPAARRNPYPLFRQLQHISPIHPTGTGAWLVTRYRDVRTALEDPHLRLQPDPELNPVRLASSSLIDATFRAMFSTRDGYDHTRLRGAVAPFFTRRRSLGIRRLIVEIVDDLLAPARDTKKLDLITDVAEDLPVYVNCAWLGIPESDWSVVCSWARVLIEQLGQTRQTPAELVHADSAVESFALYLRQMLTKKSYGFHQVDDPLAALMQARLDGVFHDDYELIATIMLLLISGKATATHAIGNCVATLLVHHPGGLDRVLSARSLLSAAVEECLRFETPVRLIARTAVFPTCIGDTPLTTGEVVLLVLAAANRDETCFAHPDTFDITRPKRAHLVFGAGTHFCIGHVHGRMETEIVLQRLIETFNVQLGCNAHSLTWSASLASRGLTTLPLEVKPRSLQR